MKRSMRSGYAHNIPSRLSGSQEIESAAAASLTRISRQISAAAADPGMSTALRSVGLLDILSSMPAGPLEIYIFTLGAKHHARLRRLATKSVEKCGLSLYCTALCNFDKINSIY
jgi:hypothetical protein